MSQKRVSEEILHLVVPSIKQHHNTAGTVKAKQPFILGLTGIQGCGKSTLAKQLTQSLKRLYGYTAIEVSLDDFYKTHADRESLRTAHPGNALLRVRGQPATHDVALAESFFEQFSPGTVPDKIQIPAFDKSLFNGEGDRASRSSWNCIENGAQIDVIVFEGWCIGFRPLSKTDIESKQALALSEQSSTSNLDGLSSQFSTSTITKHQIEDLYFVNKHLSQYCARFMGPQHLNCLVHLDTLDLVNVYTWRLEQEHMLRQAKGTSMTNEGVVKFSRFSKIIVKMENIGS